MTDEVNVMDESRKNVTLAGSLAVSLLVLAAGWLGSSITRDSETNAAQEARNIQQGIDTKGATAARDREIDGIKSDISGLRDQIERCRR